jgi:hypothetical protein
MMIKVQYFTATFAEVSLLKFPNILIYYIDVMFKAEKSCKEVLHCTLVLDITINLIIWLFGTHSIFFSILQI